jgi:hypothetical protein
LFWLHQPDAAHRLRLKKVRALYRVFRAENTREIRGLRLLREWLSPVQRAQLDAFGYFEVTGSDTGRRYRIYKGSISNVYELDDLGGLKMGWCFMPSGNLVAGDVMLAQKIALETSERSSLAVANRLLPRYVRSPVAS